MTNASACLQLYLKSKPFIKKFRNAVDVGCRDGDVAKPLAEDFENVYAFDYRDRMITNIISELPRTTMATEEE